MELQTATPATQLDQHAVCYFLGQPFSGLSAKSISRDGRIPAETINVMANPDSGSSEVLTGEVLPPLGWDARVAIHVMDRRGASAVTIN